MKRLKIVSDHVQSPRSLWVMKNIEPLNLPKKGSLKDQVIFITGASRGIGLSIALRAARDGAKIAIAAKTSDPHPTLPGTIHSAAEQIKKVGGQCLPIQCDIRDESSVKQAIEKTVETFGGIDILVNNASAIYFSKCENTDMKKYDLAMNINTRGTFMCAKYCIPHLKQSKNPHILTLSPPLYAANDTINWYAQIGIGYTMAKLGMTLVTHGLSEELKELGVGCNTLWPKTLIGTAAVQVQLGGEKSVQRTRNAEIMADAAYEILTSDAKIVNGQNFFDDEVLLSVHGQNYDLDQYKIDKNLKEKELLPDFIS